MHAKNNKARVGGTNEIIFSNLLTLILALILKWDLNSLVEIYWFQSVIIGFFWYKRLNQFDIPKGLNSFGNTTIQPGESPGIFRKIFNPLLSNFIPNFFALHYGLFHLAYFIVLLVGGMFNDGGWYLLPIIASTFVYSHWVSYKENIESDKSGDTDLAVIFFLPYKRIVPMHVIIIIGAVFAGDQSNWFYLIIFSLIKLFADVQMHTFEHQHLRKVNPEV